MGLAPGAVVAGYTVERLLGAGGMGAVYLARHPRMDRRVALKVLNDAFAADPSGRAGFQREAAIAARLDHPNIVAVYDHSGPADDLLWLSMKYIDGRDAAALGRVVPARAVALLTDAAHGLDYAHRHGVLHRDVKPANLLVDADHDQRERALVTDFGIARALDATVTGSTLTASFAYAAPERFSDRPVDHRADIYSLGCTFYELVTGRVPFPRDNPGAVIGAHLHAPPPRPSADGLPAGFDAVLARAMAKDPEHRFGSCAELAAAAAAVLAGPTVVAPRAVEPGPPPAATVRTAPPAAATVRTDPPPAATVRTGPPPAATVRTGPPAAATVRTGPPSYAATIGADSPALRPRADRGPSMPAGLSAAPLASPPSGPALRPAGTPHRPRVSPAWWLIPLAVLFVAAGIGLAVYDRGTFRAGTADGNVVIYRGSPVCRRCAVCTCGSAWTRGRRCRSSARIRSARRCGPRI